MFLCFLMKQLIAKKYLHVERTAFSASPVLTTSFKTLSAVRHTDSLTKSACALQQAAHHLPWSAELCISIHGLITFAFMLCVTLKDVCIRTLLWMKKVSSMYLIWYLCYVWALTLIWAPLPPPYACACALAKACLHFDTAVDM